MFEEDDWPCGNKDADINCFPHFPSKIASFTYQSRDVAYNNGYLLITSKAYPLNYQIPNYLDFYNDQTLKDVRQETAGAKYNITQYYQ